MAKNKTLQEHFRSNPLAWAVQLLGFGVLIVNLWLANKLAPMAQDIAVVIEKVEAIEKIDPIPRSEFEIIKDTLIRIENRQLGIGE